MVYLVYTHCYCMHLSLYALYAPSQHYIAVHFELAIVEVLKIQLVPVDHE